VHRAFSVKSIFRIFLGARPCFHPVYAPVSPVLPDRAKQAKVRAPNAKHVTLFVGAGACPARRNYQHVL